MGFNIEHNVSPVVQGLQALATGMAVGRQKAEQEQYQRDLAQQQIRQHQLDQLLNLVSHTVEQGVNRNWQEKQQAAGWAHQDARDEALAGRQTERDKLLRQQGQEDWEKRYQFGHPLNQYDKDIAQTYADERKIMDNPDLGGDSIPAVQGDPYSEPISLRDAAIQQVRRRREQLLATRRELADQIGGGGEPQTMYDENGNPIAYYNQKTFKLAPQPKPVPGTPEMTDVAPGVQVITRPGSPSMIVAPSSQPSANTKYVVDARQEAQQQAIANRNMQLGMIAAQKELDSEAIPPQYLGLRAAQYAASYAGKPLPPLPEKDNAWYQSEHRDWEGWAARNPAADPSISDGVTAQPVATAVDPAIGKVAADMVKMTPEQYMAAIGQLKSQMTEDQARMLLAEIKRLRGS